MKYELTIVMPVYNEEEIISTVIDDWKNTLRDNDINYNIIVLNDGSTDNTKRVLEKYDSVDRIQIINKDNSGHGPSVIQGYKMAVVDSEWVFQVDSDNEIVAGEFKKLWKYRNNADFILGNRSNRTESIIRQAISFFARSTVALFFGEMIKDVNCPFRLMKSKLLKDKINYLIHDFKVPNVYISGDLAKNAKNFKEVDIYFQPRTTGTTSLKSVKIVKFAFSGFLQFLRQFLKRK